MNQAVQYFLPFTIAMISLAMGLGLATTDFKAVVNAPKAAAVGLVGQLILLPLAGFFIAWAFSLPAELAVGVVLLASCPGGAHSNLFTNLAKGDTALSIALTATSGVVAVLTIPAYLAIAASHFSVDGEFLKLSFGETLSQMLLVLVLPVTLGMCIRHNFSTFSRTAEKVVKGFAIALLLFIVVGSVARQSDQVGNIFVQAGLPVLFLNVGMMLAGYSISAALRLNEKQRTAITMEIGVQNTALAVAIAMGMLQNVTIAIPAIAYSLIVYATSGMFVFGVRCNLSRGVI